jgi:hypothetical protein
LRRPERARAAEEKKAVKPEPAPKRPEDDDWDVLLKMFNKK